VLRITGYSNRLSASPGDTVQFFVSSEQTGPYRADIVRLLHGDLHPDGPGFKEEEVDTPVTAEYPGRNQPIRAGSYVIVPDAPPLHVESFSLLAFVWPTTTSLGIQGIVTKWLARNETGYGLFIGADGTLELWLGNDAGVERISSGKALIDRVWFLVAASYDTATQTAVVHQHAVPNAANGGLARSLLYPPDSADAVVSRRLSLGPPASNDAPLLIAAYANSTDSTVRARGGQLREAPADLVLPLHSGCFNGKVETPAVIGRALGPAEMRSVAGGLTGVAAALRAAVVGRWDFAANITKEGIPSAVAVDTSPHRLHGYCVNLPARGMTGHNWTGDEISYVHAPEQYGAIHFHDDDVDDARWAMDFEWIVPENLSSAIYAARLRVADDGDPINEDYVPVVVSPPRGTKTADLALILPTATYLAYANQNAAAEADLSDTAAAKVSQMQIQDLYLTEHPEYGRSIYSLHSDSSGVCYSSSLRPLLNVRPTHRTWSFPWGLAADLHLVDWLKRKGIAFDVWTDEDLHREGVDLLRRYRVVTTGTHPEYASEEMLTAYEMYQQQGGRWLYLGGNGFYWVTAFHPDNPNIIEVRRGEAGTRAWTASPGEYSNAFDGRFGGMWRARGRIPSKVCGLTFNAYGFDVASYYRRCPDSFRPECSWIFAGIGSEEVIGDFGLVLGGAAGLEIDRFDVDFGTPPSAYLLAHSEGHTDLMLPVTEELHSLVRGYHGGGDENPMIRADMIYYRTPNGGAVWATGSIAWCGSLSWNNYENNVSRITENVIRGFLEMRELP
jgi:N,N-dimethylformamidase